MKQLTDNMKKEIKNLLNKGCTDSDIEEFCEENKAPLKQTFRYIAELTAPKQCKGCKHIELVPSMPPCTSCCRIHQKDYFEPENS